MSECTCDEPRRYPDCAVHVDCDERCMALNDPQTIEELKMALQHWQTHSYLHGCSHGC